MHDTRYQTLKFKDLKADRAFAVHNTMAAHPVSGRAIPDSYCFFTTRFLRKTGQLRTITNRYLTDNHLTSFIQKKSPHFLKWVTKNTIGLTSVIARFELGLLLIHQDEVYEDEIFWPCDPLPVIFGLVQNDLTNESIRSGKFCMTLSDKIIGSFEVEEITPFHFQPIPPYL